MDTLFVVLAVFAALVIIKVPVAVSLGMSALVGMVLGGFDAANIVTQSYRGLDSFTLLAVPFFLTLGFVINHTSITSRLLAFANLVVGRVSGGLGHVNVFVSMLFGGISGSATADTAGIGSVLIPLMRKQGYSAGYSAAITAISSTLGSVIPPSIIMIVYGATMGVSVGALFLGGALPGLVLGLGFMGVNGWVSRSMGPAVDPDSDAPYNDDPGDGERASTAPPSSATANSFARLPRGLRVTVRAFPTLLAPAFIVVGITSGTFTATEAGAAALVYVVLLGSLFYREFGVRETVSTLRESVALYSLPLLAAALAVPFGWILVLLGANDFVVDTVESLGLGVIDYLLVAVVIFLVVGLILDAIPAIFIFAPLMKAGAVELSIPDLQLGVLITVVLAAGLVTPPYGLCLLIASRISGAPVPNIMRHLLPFYAVVAVVILLLVVWPGFSLALPDLLMSS